MRNRSVALALAATVSSACPSAGPRADAVAAACDSPTGDLRSVELRGEWSAELTPDSAIALADARPAVPLTGSIRLTRRDSSALGVVYGGVYEADLRSVGLARPAGEVLVSVPAGDTVRIVLDPTVDHGNLELVGRCRDGRLVGSWIRTGAPARAWGRYVLRRSKE